MSPKNGNLTEYKCWPEYDIYFKVGVSFLQEKLNSHGNQRIYFFLHLNGYTLRDFLACFPAAADDHVVIISSPRLFPLADFWMATHHQVCAAFDSKTDIETIVTTLKNPPSERRSGTVIKYSTEISPKEVVILSHYLSSGNMDYIQQRYCRSYKTVQQWKTKLAHKFNVRKLEYLTLKN